MDREAPDPKSVLSALFEKARQADEFEYCCALLRVRGLEGPGWDPLRESMTLTQQLLSLIQAPLDQGVRLRLVLFLYCHVTEIDDLYRIVANMLCVTRGERYSIDPFPNLPKHADKSPIGYCLNPRIDKLTQLARDAGIPEVGELFSRFFIRPVRNAFYHSDYILTPTSFNIRHGEGVNFETVISREVKLEWLAPRLELGINTALALLELLAESVGSYKQDKVVRGRMAHDGSYTDIQLTTEPGYGLTGFKGPPDPGMAAGSQTGSA